MSSQFVRESRGNYKYGSKKIQVMNENDNLLIKCGNEVMTFDNFIDKFGSEGKGKT